LKPLLKGKKGDKTVLKNSEKGKNGETTVLRD